MYNEAQGLLEGESSTISVFTSSNQFMLYSLLNDCVILLMVVPCSLPSCPNAVHRFMGLEGLYNLTILQPEVKEFIPRPRPTNQLCVRAGRGGLREGDRTVEGNDLKGDCSLRSLRLREQADWGGGES